MRVILFLALLVPIIAIDDQINNSPTLPHLQSKQARILEDKPIAFLQCLRNTLNNGDEEIGIPSFNPLKIKDINIDLNFLKFLGIKGHIMIKDFQMSGIPKWDLQILKITITVIPPGARAVVKISWAAVNVSGKYEADLNIFGHTIVGSGSISGNLSKLGFELHLKLRAGLNGTIITSSDLDVSLGSSDLLIENLTIDGHDVSGPLQQLATRLPNFLQAYGDAIDGLFEVYIIPVLQKLPNGNVSLPKIGKCGF